MKRGNAVLLLLLLIGIMPLFAQQKKDSIQHLRSDSLKVYLYHISALDTQIIAIQKRYPADTLLTGFQRFDPALEQVPFSTNLGNTGLASKSMIFGGNVSTDFNAGMNAFDAYRFTTENVNYFASVAPFTELFYGTGSRKEQVFHAIHSHTIKKQLVIGGKYRLVNSWGIQEFRQKADISNIAATARFNTRNKRYGFIGNYIHNRITNQENGGITNDSIYEAVRAGTADTSYTYYLKSAQTYIRETSAFLQQYVNLFPTDTISKQDTSARRFRPNIGRFSHSISYFRQTNTFADAELNNGLFPIITDDTTFASDSMRWVMVENRVAWTNPETTLKHQPRKLRLYAAFTYRYTEVHQNSGTSFLNQYIPSGGFTLDIADLFSVAASAEYVTGTYGNGNYLGQARLAFFPGANKKDRGVITLKGSYSSLQPDWCSTSFSSKYFTWYRSFEPQQRISVTLQYDMKRLSAGIDVHNINNFVYFGSDALPRQRGNGSVSVYAARVRKDFVFGKFEVRNHLVMQYTKNSDIIHLPLLVAGQSWYFTQPMFKKALLAQIALDLFYNTPFFADSWMPATQQFFLQNGVKTGNYLYADLALNFKIKRARLFLKLSHLNSGLMGYNYYSVPHYPMQDRAIKFGVSWLFYD